MFHHRQLITAACGLLLTSLGVAQTFPLSENSWSNPEFRDRFLGSYGMNTTLTPGVNPDEAKVLQEVAALLQADNVTQGIARVREVLTPESSGALDFTLANLLYQSEKYEEAAEVYKAAIKKFPSFQRAYLNLGRTMVNLEKFSEALPFLRKALELQGGDGTLYGLIAFCYMNEGRYGVALDAYRMALVLQPESADWKMGKLRCLMNLDMHEEAVGTLYELIAKDPKNADYWKWQSNAFQATEQVPLAAANLAITYQMGKSTPEAMALLADIYINDGLYQLAMPLYGEALKSGKLRFERAYRTLTFLSSTGALKDARDLLASMRAAYPGMTSAEKLQLMTVESRLNLSEDKPEEAARVLAEIIKEDPMNGRALLTLSDLHQKQGDLVKAEFYAAEAMKVSSVERDACIRLAQIKVIKREYKEAATHLHRALDLRSEPHVEEFLQRVEQAAARL